MIDSVIDRWRAVDHEPQGQHRRRGGELGSWRDDIAPPRDAATQAPQVSPQPPHADASRPRRRCRSRRAAADPRTQPLGSRQRPPPRPQHPAPAAVAEPLGAEQSGAAAADARSGLVVPRAENRAADAHMGRAHGDRGRDSPRSCPSTAASARCARRSWRSARNAAPALRRAGGMHISPAIVEPIAVAAARRGTHRRPAAARRPSAPRRRC